MTQLDLFHPRTGTAFDAVLHTPQGGSMANKFIRLAIGLKRRGFKHYGAKAICERLRWHYSVMRVEGEEFKINNNWTSRLARFAEERAPELQGFFRNRKLKT